MKNDIDKAVEWARSEIASDQQAELTNSYLELLIQAAEAQKWQTIDTAPRDGGKSYILGVNLNGNPPYQAFLMRDTFVPSDEFTHPSPGACWRERHAEWPCYPTHWRPLDLPQPPKGHDK